MNNSRYFFIGLTLITLFIMVVNSFNWMTTEEEIFFSDFLQQLDNGRIKTVNVEDSTLRGEYTDRTKFVVQAPVDSLLATDSENFITRMLDNGVEVNIQKTSENSWYWIILVNWGPFIFLILIWVYLFRRNSNSSGVNKIFSLGSSRAKRATVQDRRETFKDVAGIEESKEDLKEIVDFLKDPNSFRKLGGRIPKGVLMVGPPGTGKTLLAKAVAGEANVPFFSISGSDFVEMFVGVGASRVRGLFEEALKSSPCIIFIDEIDAVGRHRGAGLGGGHDEREQTLNQLLVEMDGFDSRIGVIIIAATNRVDILDPALLRPGRFDRHIEVPLPDLKGRKAILEVHSRKVKLDANVDLMKVAKGTPGFSGAELSNLINEAALHSAKNDFSSVTKEALDWARDKLTMGAERKSFKMDQIEKSITSYHEAGHAVVSAFVEKSDALHKITIIPRGIALGVTAFLPDNDKFSMDKVELLSKITISMGGRAAEEIFCEDITTGAENDFKYSTDLAYRMVCDWGMSDKVGPLAVKVKSGNFLALEYYQDDAVSDDTQKLVDSEVQSILTDCYEKAKNILKNNSDTVERLAKKLLEEETVDGKDFLELVGREGLPKT